MSFISWIVVSKGFNVFRIGYQIWNNALTANYLITSFIENVKLTDDQLKKQRAIRCCLTFRAISRDCLKQIFVINGVKISQLVEHICDGSERL
jgi:hypothetical protein